MMPNTSIVIPTFQHFEDCLRPCITSIIQFTDLSNVEVIVVANGCGDDGTKEYVESLGGPFKLIWFDNNLGYAKATNEGMKVAKGEYIILLNNDTKLLDYQVKNDWIKILEAPFLDDDKMGITGPMKTFSESANAEFLIFFCVMISRKLIDAIGYLDESFYSYGEDTDFAMKAIQAGFKIKQVPKDCNDYYDDKRMVASFPIFHEGNVSHKNWLGGEKLIEKNNNILRERYNKKTKVNIDDALKCDGFMSEQELIWLADTTKTLKDNSILAECGSWHGRSTKSITSNMSQGSILFAIDTFNGSVNEQDSNHASAKSMQGDAAFYEFADNLWKDIVDKKIIPLRMSSENATKLLKAKNIKLDFCFIDASHDYESVKIDLEKWLPLMKIGSTISGHDYYEDKTSWLEGVKRAVDEKFKDVGVAKNTSIWYHKVTKEDLHQRRSTYDCFPLNNELSLLEKRFEELWDHVDRFVVVEANLTHGNKPKPYYFKDNLKRFEKYLSKVSHVMISDYNGYGSWEIERHQRDCIMRALTNCKDNDVIIISDLDEIPNPEAIKNYNIGDGIKSFEMDLYYYNMNCRAKDKWTEAKILPYSQLKSLTPCGARYTKADVIPNGGKHLSYFGGVESIKKKIEDTAHQEYNKDVFKNEDRIKNAIENGTDLFGRNLEFEKI